MKLEPQCRTLPELLRAFADIAEQCVGTKVRPEECWKHKGILLGVLPAFNQDPTEYEIAIAIVEDKPVWRGSDIYSKKNGGKVSIQKVYDGRAEIFTTFESGASCLGVCQLSDLTWTPPNPNAEWKRRFEAGERIQAKYPGGHWSDVIRAEAFNVQDAIFQLAPRTITIEGCELPLPIDRTSNMYFVDWGDKRHYFESREDWIMWETAMDKWLRGEK